MKVCGLDELGCHCCVTLECRKSMSIAREAIFREEAEITTKMVKEAHELYWQSERDANNAYWKERFGKQEALCDAIRLNNESPAAQEGPE